MMEHDSLGGPGRHVRLTTSHNHAQGSRRDLRVRDGAMARLMAAMATPDAFDPERRLESESAYFRRRSAEEYQAASEAAGLTARAAHQELAMRYARLPARGEETQGRRSPQGEAIAGQDRLFVDAAQQVTFRPAGRSSGVAARARAQRRRSDD